MKTEWMSQTRVFGYSEKKFPAPGCASGIEICLLAA
jgi:hypothetical protein